MSKPFAKLYDTLMSPLEKKEVFSSMRKQLINKATGVVLEIGAGTGINFNLYPRTVKKLLATDPNPEMIKRAVNKLDNTPISIELQLANAESLPFPDSYFDTVVGTLVFCSIPQPQKALIEAARVLKSGGTLLLFEHVKMPNPILSKAQVLLTPLWKHLCDGCHLDRETVKLIEESPFHIEEQHSVYKGLFVTLAARKN